MFFYARQGYNVLKTLLTELPCRVAGEKEWEKQSTAKQIQNERVSIKRMVIFKYMKLNKSFVSLVKQSKRN